METSKTKRLIKPLPGETWARIEEFPDYYVSNMGRIKSERVGHARILAQCVKAGRGYLYVGLYAPGSRRQTKLSVHRLVAEHYVSNPLGLDTVDHINGNKCDNRAANLRWATMEDNIGYYIAQEGHKHKKPFSGWIMRGRGGSNR